MLHAKHCWYVLERFPSSLSAKHTTQNFKDKVLKHVRDVWNCLLIKTLIDVCM